MSLYYYYSLYEKSIRYTFYFIFFVTLNCLVQYVKMTIDAILLCNTELFVKNFIILRIMNAVKYYIEKYGLKI